MKLIFTIFILFLSLFTDSQVFAADDEMKYLRPAKEELYLDFNSIIPDTLKLKGAPQGFAIHGKYALSLRAGGQCIVIDLKNKKFVSSFQLAGIGGHCNSCEFGIEKYSDDSEFPLLYINECTGEKSCYVVDISLKGSRTVQRIFYEGKEFKYAHDWLPQPQKGFIYIYGGKHMGKKYLKKFRMPSLAESDENGEVRISPDEVLDTFEIDGLNISQGSQVRKGKAYLPSGPYKNNLIHVISLNRKKPTAVYLLGDQNNEPEDMDFRGRWAYVLYHNVKEGRNALIYRMLLR